MDGFNRRDWLPGPTQFWPRNVHSQNSTSQRGYEQRRNPAPSYHRIDRSGPVEVIVLDSDDDDDDEDAPEGPGQHASPARRSYPAPSVNLTRRQPVGPSGLLREERTATLLRTSLFHASQPRLNDVQVGQPSLTTERTRPSSLQSTGLPQLQSSTSRTQPIPRRSGDFFASFHDNGRSHAGRDPQTQPAHVSSQPTPRASDSIFAPASNFTSPMVTQSRPVQSLFSESNHSRHQHASHSQSSCNNCTRVKLRCNGGHPCGPCSQRGDRCSYPSVSPPAAASRRLSAESPHQMGRSVGFPPPTGRSPVGPNNSPRPVSEHTRPGSSATARSPDLPSSVSRRPGKQSNGSTFGLTRSPFGPSSPGQSAAMPSSAGRNSVGYRDSSRPSAEQSPPGRHSKEGSSATTSSGGLSSLQRPYTNQLARTRSPAGPSPTTGSPAAQLATDQPSRLQTNGHRDDPRRSPPGPPPATRSPTTQPSADRLSVRQINGKHYLLIRSDSGPAPGTGSSTIRSSAGQTSPRQSNGIQNVHTRSPAGPSLATRSPVRQPSADLSSSRPTNGNQDTLTRSPAGSHSATQGPVNRRPSGRSPPRSPVASVPRPATSSTAAPSIQSLPLQTPSAPTAPLDQAPIELASVDSAPISSASVDAAPVESWTPAPASPEPVPALPRRNFVIKLSTGKGTEKNTINPDISANHPLEESRGTAIDPSERVGAIHDSTTQQSRVRKRLRIGRNPEAEGPPRASESEPLEDPEQMGQTPTSATTGTHAPERANQDDDEADPMDLSNESDHKPRIELDVNSLKPLFEKMQKGLYAWREQSVQADLRQATIDMTNHPRLGLDESIPNPFQALAERRRAESDVPIPQVTNTNVSNSLGKLQPNKKSFVVRAPETQFWTGATLLPRYRAIGRLSASFLARNFRTAKYRPYDADDEVQDPEATQKYAELEERFKRNDEDLLAQRHCQELVWLFRPWMEELFTSLNITADDVVYFFTQDHFDSERQMKCNWSTEASQLWREEQMRRCRNCDLADPESRREHFSESFSQLPRPDDDSLALAGLVAHLFHEIAQMSLWHIVIGDPIQPRYEDPKAATTKNFVLCPLCFRHQCPDHGSYEEPNSADHEDEDPESVRAFINDEEHDTNLRKFMALPLREQDESPSHICGVFCVEPSQTLQQLLGRLTDGRISGEGRLTPPIQPILKDDELCCPLCFWNVTNRRNVKLSEVKFQPFLSQSQRILIDKLVPFYLDNKRGPCLISRIIKEVSCSMVFEYMIYRICLRPHPCADPGANVSATSDAGTVHRTKRVRLNLQKKKKQAPTSDVWRSAELDSRPPFMPCSHPGPCLNNPACSCFKNKVHCERFCGCDNTCKRRFPGCTCTLRSKLHCYKDNRCECWRANRECDPILCGKCGAIEVLDSSNKYRPNVRQGKCLNTRIQLGLPAPTTKAPSQVEGYGLYAKADIAQGGYLGEYTGEIVGSSEANRRGAMYHVSGQEYLFKVNKEQEIDASKNGNKMRFMNNAQREEHINVEAKSMLIDAVCRVGLFAKRSIKAGEELLYRYNYPDSVVQNFWEPGERPPDARVRKF